MRRRRTDLPTLGCVSRKTRDSSRSKTTTHDSVSLIEQNMSSMY